MTVQDQLRRNGVATPSFDSWLQSPFAVDGQLADPYPSPSDLDGDLAILRLLPQNPGGFVLLAID